MRWSSAAKVEPRPRHFGLEEIWLNIRSSERLSSFGLAWHHLRQALIGMVTSPLTTLLTIFTCATALALFGGLGLFLENSSAFLVSSGESVNVSVFLKDTARQEEISAFQKELREFPSIKELQYRSKSEALELLRSTFQDSALVFEGLDKDNPLPASFEVKFAEANQEVFGVFKGKFSAHPIVEHIEYNQGMVEQISSLLESLRLAGWVAVALVFISVAFIISNTVRLALHTHREEIEIMRLVGATDNFVRTPYLLAGLLQGLLGAVLSVAMVYALHHLIIEQLSASSVLQLIFPDPAFLSWWWLSAVALTGAMIGVIGSYLAVRKFRYL